MTDLDLDAVKERLEWFRDSKEQCRRSPGQVSLAGYAAAAIDCGRDVEVLVAEVERLQRLVGPVVPSESAYDRMAQALADERAAVVEHCNKIELLEADRERLLALLTEVLHTFQQVGGEHMAFASVRIETLAGWLAARGAL